MAAHAQIPVPQEGGDPLRSFRTPLPEEGVDRDHPLFLRRGEVFRRRTGDRKRRCRKEKKDQNRMAYPSWQQPGYPLPFFFTVARSGPCRNRPAVR
ncbi:MAG: hypothetical protein Kow00128_03920 [Deltaproteobacteria bacterium]